MLSSPVCAGRKLGGESCACSGPDCGWLTFVKEPAMITGTELLEALPVAVYTTDADGRITFYNRAAAELWGRHPELGSSQWCGSWRLYWPDGRPLPHNECPMAIALAGRCGAWRPSSKGPMARACGFVPIRRRCATPPGGSSAPSTC